MKLLQKKFQIGLFGSFTYEFRSAEGCLNGFQLDGYFFNKGLSSNPLNQKDVFDGPSYFYGPVNPDM